MKSGNSFNSVRVISWDSYTLLQMMSGHFPACVRPLNSVESWVFDALHEPPSWIWMLIRPLGRVCYNPWCNVLRKVLVSTVTKRSLKGQFEDFEDVWKPKNLNLLALQEMVSIKNHKASGLSVKMVFLIISTPMIFTTDDVSLNSILAVLDLPLCLLGLSSCLF